MHCDYKFLTSRNTTLSGLLFFYLCFSYENPIYAQTRWFAGVRLGPNISFNQSIIDKPLPDRVRVIQRVGMAFDIYAEFKVSERISLQGSAKLAQRNMGFSYKNIITELDNVSGAWRNRQSGKQFTGDSPLHFNIGAQIKSNKIGRRLILSGGGGIACMIIRPSFLPDIGARTTAGNYEQVSIILEYSRIRLNNWLVNVNTVLFYQLKKEKSLTFTLAYNQGLRTVYKMQSREFVFRTPDFEATYQLTIKNRCSYAAFQMGYQLPVRRLPLIRKKRAA